MYLANQQFIKEVHQRILGCFDQTQHHIILAHSLGSVIAYNFLQDHPEFKVVRLITLGSPLAFRVIQEKIFHPISRPNALYGDWYNFYSPEDFLTAFPLNLPPFQFQPAIINQAINTLIDHPHDISGYLQHPKVRQCLIELFS